MLRLSQGRKDQKWTMHYRAAYNVLVLPWENKLNCGHLLRNSLFLTHCRS